MLIIHTDNTTKTPPPPSHFSHCSFYEYMLKCWLQGSKTEDMYRSMYDDSMDGVHKLLAQKSTPSGLSYIADLNGGNLDHKMDHLVCFMGGSLALGAYTNPDGLDSPKAQRDLKLAKAVTYTCYQMYARQPTGIAPEYVRFVKGRDMETGSNARFYILRPETVESLFILNQVRVVLCESLRELCESCVRVVREAKSTTALVPTPF